MKPSITIAIPAYNEEENIEWVVKDCLKDLSKYFDNYEVLVIDDGSRDKTGQIVDRLTKAYENVRVIHQPNKGYSAAMMVGIRNAKREFVAYLPADGQYLVSDMAKMYPLMQASDLVLGFRGIRKDYNFYRKVLSYGYLIFLWLLFGITVRDLNGPNIWRTREVNKLKKIYSVKSKGVFLLAEIVARFQAKGLRISQAPSRYRSRRGGAVKNAKISVPIQTAIDALRLKYRMLTNRV